MKFCTQCGHQNNDEALFCSSCGTKFAAAAQNIQKDNPKISEKEEKDPKVSSSQGLPLLTVSPNVDGNEENAAALFPSNNPEENETPQATPLFTPQSTSESTAPSSTLQPAQQSAPVFTPQAAPVAPPQQPPIPGSPPTNNPAFMGNLYSFNPTGSKKMLSSNPAINAVKTAGSSGGFLLASFILSISMIISFINALQPNDIIGIFNDAIDILEKNSIDTSELGILEDALDIVQSFITVFQIIPLIPIFIICIGLWFIYISCSNSSSQNVSTTGFTIIKVVMILTLIAFLAIPVIIFASLLMAMLAMLSSSNTEAVVGVVIVMMAEIIVVMFPILYYAGIIKTLNSVSRTINTAIPFDNVSGFVAVVNYIIAIFGIISATLGILLWGTSLLSFIGSILNAAVLIIFANIIFNYKKSMTTLKIAHMSSSFDPTMPR